MKIADIINAIEAFAPTAYQEDYDNSGLLTGDRNAEATGVLLTLDCTEQVIEEAVKMGCNLIIAHHPVIFSGLKKLTGANYVERTVILAIRNHIAVYACHTNIDNVRSGVNHKIGDKLGLEHMQVLVPRRGMLKKLVTFVPPTHHQEVLDALFGAGAGNIGNYDSCSFSAEGNGTFRGNAATRPFTGEPGKLSTEQEIRVETIFAAQDEGRVIAALQGSHPYEEAAFDIYNLSNSHPLVGSGMQGELTVPMAEKEFLKHVKNTFKVPFIKHTPLTGKMIKKVAICGGSGRFLLRDALGSGADAFITEDLKYHEYFDADGRILVIDTGHYESEQFTPEIFYDIIKKKFATFAIHLSKINTNPVNYF
jgi:dinuclear metal center YbgI/SA1388 family protein